MRITEDSYGSTTSQITWQHFHHEAESVAKVAGNGELGLRGSKIIQPIIIGAA